MWNNEWWFQRWKRNSLEGWEPQRLTWDNWPTALCVVAMYVPGPLETDNVALLNTPNSFIRSFVRIHSLSDPPYIQPFLVLTLFSKSAFAKVCTALLNFFPKLIWRLVTCRWRTVQFLHYRWTLLYILLLKASPMLRNCAVKFLSRVKLVCIRTSMSCPGYCLWKWTLLLGTEEYKEIRERKAKCRLHRILQNSFKKWPTHVGQELSRDSLSPNKGTAFWAFFLETLNSFYFI
jgi:hypothetical protein